MVKSPASHDDYSQLKNLVTQDLEDADRNAEQQMAELEKIINDDLKNDSKQQISKQVSEVKEEKSLSVLDENKN